MHEDTWNCAAEEERVFDDYEDPDEDEEKKKDEDPDDEEGETTETPDDIDELLAL